MLVINIFLFSIVIISSLLAFLVYSRNKKSITNVSFAILIIVGAFWALTIAIFQMAKTVGAALLWDRVIYICAIFVPSSFVFFAYAFPEEKIKIPTLHKIAYFLPIIISIPILLFTRLWIQEIIVSPEGNSVILGPFYIVWAIWFMVYMVWTFWIFLSKYLKSYGVRKIQLRYMILASIFPAIGSMPFNIIAPLFGNYRLIWIGPFTLTATFIVISYAIIRHRFMDIRVVMGRGTVYLFTLVILISLGFLIMFLNSKLAAPLSVNIVGPFAMVVGIFLFQFIFRFFEKLASKYFYYTFYSYQTVLTDLGRKLTQVLELDKLSSSIVSTLMSTMKLDRTVILLREPGDGEYQIQKNIGFREENGISLVKDNFLTIWLERTQKPLVYEEISLIIRDTTEKEERERLERLRANMKRIEAALCLPLFLEEKIVGMIVLGNKLSGEPYSTQDIELLTNLANQVSIALQNAKSYSEIKGFSKKLEREVEKATAELKEAYEELKKLDKAKSEFISIASHQLRTPLTAIKGYISMMREKLYGKPPEKMGKPLENIYISNERLIKLVNDLLNVSRIESGKMEMNLEKLSMEEMITSAIEELRNTAKEKNIYLRWEKAEKALPKISVDREKIRQVIMNVVDNAIRYTEKGGVTVQIKNQKSKIKIIVKDTGAGLTKYELSKMFESFSRGAAGTRLYTEGVGLGLYVAKRFVEMHHGKIWAESKGKGKGSTFYIELPIK